jgi:ATP synthase protein I
MPANLKSNLLAASSLGIMLVASTAIGFAMGFFLDKFLGTSPYLTLIMFLVGIIAGFWTVIKEIKKINEKS